MKNRMIRKFHRKLRRALKGGQEAFNGRMVTQSDAGTIYLTQTAKIDKLHSPGSKNVFIIQRSLAHYVGVTVSPDVCARTDSGHPEINQ